MSSVTQFHQIKLAFVPTRMAKYVHTNVANVRAWGPPCDRAQTEHDGQSCTFILGGYLRLGISTSRRAQVAAFNGTTTIPLKKFHLWNCIWTFLISDLNWWKTKMKKLGFGEWNSMGRRWKRGNLVEGGGSPGDGCNAAFGEVYEKRNQFLTWSINHKQCKHDLWSNPHVLRPLVKFIF